MIRRWQGSSLALVAAASFVMIPLSVGGAQGTPAGEPDAPQFWIASVSRGKPALAPLVVERMPVLGRRITLRLKHATLKEALADIVAQSDLRLGYSDDVLPPARHVDLSANRITVVAALTDVLFGTGLDVIFTKEGKASLARRALGASADAAGAIVGQVVDSATRHPLAGADVFLEGTRWRTTTDSAGRYRLAEVDSGAYKLTARRLGYAKRSRPVVVRVDGEETVDLALPPVAARLDELVTTATGRRRRMDVPNDITTINADSVMQAAPVRSVTELLENRVPGLTVQRTSGAPGDPARLRLLGASSPLLNNDPIVVVDGVRVYAQQSAARSENLAARSGFATPSPLDYIDPNSIETLEVVKGPAAASLYGPDAANGVIVITTKKGKAGPTRWTASVAHGRSQMATSYPDLLFPWGHDLYDPVNAFCPLSSPAFVCARDSVVSFQMLNDPALTMLDKGHRTDLSLTASGGTQALTYSLTGSVADELGLIKLPAYEVDRYQQIEGRSAPDWMRRPQRLKQWGATSTITARLGAANVSLTSTLSRTTQQRSTLEQQLGSLATTFLNRSSGVYYSGQALIQGGAQSSVTDFNIAGYRTRVTDAATAFTNGLSASWPARSWLLVSANAGINIDQRADESLLPRSRDSLYREGSDVFNPPSPNNGYATGNLSVGTGTSIQSTVGASAVATAPLGHGLTFRFASGANYIGSSINDVTTTNPCLGYGSTDISRLACPVAGTGIGATRATANDATFGWYLAPSLGSPKFNVDLGLRLDGGSRYGSHVNGFKLPAFPKLGFSYLLSDEAWFPFKEVVQSFRVRAAYGRAGTQPGPADRLRLYNTAQSTSVTGDYVTLQTLGNTELKPERTADLEAGFDADLLDGRLSVSLTGDRKTKQDAILPTPLPPSVYGGGSILRNIGVIRNTTLQLTVNATLLRTNALLWSTAFSWQRDRNRVVRLGPGVLPFYPDGDPYNGTTASIGASGTRVAAGYPLFGRWARPILGYADANGDGVLEPAEILLGDTAVYIGETVPPSQFTVAPSVALWHGALTFTGMLTHVGGFSQKYGVAQSLAPFTRGSVDSTASLAEQLATGLVSKNIDFNWIQTVTTTRVDNLSVNVRVPVTVARRLGAQQLSVALQGSNLGLWSNYRGPDPNVNAFVNGNGLNDTGVLPPPRTWRLAINVSY